MGFKAMRKTSRAIKERIVRQRISDCIKQLKKIGSPIKAEDLKRMQDDANREAFSLLQAELKHNQVAFNIKPMKSLARKCKVLEAMLMRIKQQTPTCNRIDEKEQRFWDKLVDVFS